MKTELQQLSSLILVSSASSSSSSLFKFPSLGSDQDYIKKEDYDALKKGAGFEVIPTAQNVLEMALILLFAEFSRTVPKFNMFGVNVFYSPSSFIHLKSSVSPNQTILLTKK